MQNQSKRLDFDNTINLSSLIVSLADMYPAGSVHAEEFESLYIRSRAGSLSSRLLDLRAIGGTLSPILAEHGLWTQMVVC
jgi:hypothetical protein